MYLRPNGYLPMVETDMVEYMCDTAFVLGIELGWKTEVTNVIYLSPFIPFSW